MENGIIKNWDDMGLLWDYAFYEQMKLPSTSMVKYYCPNHQ